MLIPANMGKGENKESGEEDLYIHFQIVESRDFLLSLQSKPENLNEEIWECINSERRYNSSANFPEMAAFEGNHLLQKGFFPHGF